MMCFLLCGGLGKWLTTKIDRKINTFFRYMQEKKEKIARNERFFLFEASQMYFFRRAKDMVLCFFKGKIMCSEKLVYFIDAFLAKIA